MIDNGANPSDDQISWGDSQKVGSSFQNSLTAWS